MMMENTSIKIWKEIEVKKLIMIRKENTSQNLMMIENKSKRLMMMILKENTKKCMMIENASKNLMIEKKK